ncbi:hypothetical protein ABMA27_009211 [Loxostege sticticalis]|uniref:Uncharacterized protein n=1 Tax=Loxostege sticticalis TaxID=481309 RepID=A0ABR3HAT1_LOXSC
MNAINQIVHVANNADPERRRKLYHQLRTIIDLVENDLIQSKRYAGTCPHMVQQVPVTPQLTTENRANVCDCVFVVDVNRFDSDSNKSECLLLLHAKIASSSSYGAFPTSKGKLEAAITRYTFHSDE